MRRRGAEAALYVIEDMAGNRKVGVSTEPRERLQDFAQVGLPFKLVHETPHMARARRVERAAHKLLTLAGKHIAGEWFSATLDECIEAIERAERLVAAQLDNETPTYELVGVRFTAEKMAEIEDWWRGQRSIRNRVDAIRALVDEGLEAVKKKEAVKERKKQ